MNRHQETNRITLNNLINIWIFSLVLVFGWNLPEHIIFVAALGWSIGVITAFFIMRYLDDRFASQRHD